MTIIIFCGFFYISFFFCFFLLLPSVLLRKVFNISFAGILFCLSTLEVHFFWNSFLREVFNRVCVFAVVLVFGFRFLACPLSYLSVSRNPVLASNLTWHACSHNQILKQFFRVPYLQWCLCYHRWDYLLIIPFDGRNIFK